MTVPTVIKKINESLGDDERVIYYENLLVGMYASVLLLLLAILTIIIGYFYLNIIMIDVIGKCIVLLILGTTFSMVVRIDLPVKWVDYILSGLALVSFVFIAVSYYDSIGPSVWTIGIIQMGLSLTRMKKTLLYATELGLAIAILHIMVFELTSNPIGKLGVTFYVIQIILFMILFIIFSVVHTISINRYRYAEKQYKAIQAKNQEINDLNREIQASKEKVKYLAYHDQLTGLPNRHYLWKKLERDILLAQKRGEILGLVYLDIDDFKAINDKLGHDYGDQVLIVVAEKIRQTIRVGDTVARIGGDEFLILIEDVKEIENIQGIVKKLVNQFGRPFNIKGEQCLITVSIGFALYPSDGEDVETVVRRADIAMYEAKKNGRNQYCYFSKEMEKSHSID